MGSTVFQNSYIDMLLLKILQKKDMYGYELIQEIENIPNSDFRVKTGTIYPILHTLEKQGYVIAYEKSENSRQVRKYYKITEAGKRCLDCKIQDWEKYSAAVNYVLEG